MPKLRVGVGDIVDVKPLAWGFLKGHHADLFTTESQPLGTAVRMLADGVLDAALVPTVEVARHPELEVLPDLCVAFSGVRHRGPSACRTLSVDSHGHLAEATHVYLGREARTSSAAALRILLAERHGASPRFLDTAPPDKLGAGEAALLMGGAALRGREAGAGDLRRLDLAAAWRELTGVPLVPGLWAVRPGLDRPDLSFYFKSSLRYGLASIDAIARESAAELGIDWRALAETLRSSIDYVLQDDERRGVEELLSRARRHGILPADAAIRYREP